MQPIKVYRVSCRPKDEGRRPAQRDHFPSVREGRMWFEDVRQDRTWHTITLEELVIIPPTREGICTYLNGSGYELDAKLIDSWTRPDGGGELEDGYAELETLRRKLLEIDDEPAEPGSPSAHTTTRTDQRT
jgi:hypothetical protein